MFSQGNKCPPRSPRDGGFPAGHGHQQDLGQETENSVIGQQASGGRTYCMQNDTGSIITRHQRKSQRRCGRLASATEPGREGLGWVGGVRDCGFGGLRGELSVFFLVSALSVLVRLLACLHNVCWFFRCRRACPCRRDVGNFQGGKGVGIIHNPVSLTRHDV